MMSQEEVNLSRWRYKDFTLTNQYWTSFFELAMQTKELGEEMLLEKITINNSHFLSSTHFSFTHAFPILQTFTVVVALSMIVEMYKSSREVDIVNKTTKMPYQSELCSHTLHTIETLFPGVITPVHTLQSSCGTSKRSNAFVFGDLRSHCGQSLWMR